MYDSWLFLTLFLFSSKKRRKGEWSSKTGFKDPMDFHRIIQSKISLRTHKIGQVVRAYPPSIHLPLFYKYNGYNKRYSIIDQQIARYFVHYSEYFSSPLPFYAIQIINPFLNSRISAIHDKGWIFSQSWNPFTP